MELRFAWIALVAGLLVGCSSQTASRVEQNWGSAQRDNTEAMIVNPSGSEPGHDPGDPMQGITVEFSVGAHRARQKRSVSQPTSIINIGTVGR